MTRPNAAAHAALPLVPAHSQAAGDLHLPSGILCPELYRFLQERVGSVKIVSQGESFVGHLVPDPTRSNRRRVQITAPGEYYRVSCPYCNDTRHRLWVSHMYGQVDGDGNKYTYLAHCYNEDCLSLSGRRRHFEELVLGFRNVSERRPSLALREGFIDANPLRVVQLPGTVAPLLTLPEDHQAVQFLMGRRRYTEAMVRKYEIGVCIGADQRYLPAHGRIIFPIYFNQQLVGWQARFPDDVNWKALGIAKYYTLPGFKKTHVLYNIDVARHKEFLVVCEGVTDVHVGGDHFVALFGKSLHQNQRMLLQTVGDRKPLIFLLDPDAREEMEGIIHSFLMSPGQHPVLPVYLPEGFDPGDYDRTTLWNLITAEASRRGLPIRFTS